VDTAGSGHELLPQAHLARIVRTASSTNMKFLCLKIGKCSPIWCPPSAGSIAPKHVDEALIEYQNTIHAVKEDAELDTGHDTARCQGRHFLGRESQSIQGERRLLDEEGQLLNNESRFLDEKQQHLEHKERHLENKRRHLAQRRLLLDPRRQIWSINRVVVLQYTDSQYACTLSVFLQLAICVTVSFASRSISALHSAFWR
jgi:hypothetical protein